MEISGKKVREEKMKLLKKGLEEANARPNLAVIQVGDDPASEVYIEQKEKAAHQLNYFFTHYCIPEKCPEEKLKEEIEALNNDDRVDGIIVQMPLPSHIDSHRIQNLIDPSKDVDGLTDINGGKLFHGVPELIPCTPKGIMDLLEYYNITVEGKNAVIIGRSILVGRPMGALLTNQNATVTICHSKTENLEYYTKNADIIIVAVGQKHFLKREMVKDGAVVIDVGINRVEGKNYGDADFENLKDKCSYITPVPGGVGPMTVYELMENTYQAYKLRRKL
jgi:methylenetetrahydrofolate dehydrogenase (NADP+)/methenyltetrahydrofolate cyclohydrolase